MELEQLLKEKLVKAFKALGLELSINDIIIEHSKDPSHGD